MNAGGADGRRDNDVNFSGRSNLSKSGCSRNDFRNRNPDCVDRRASLFLVANANATLSFFMDARCFLIFGAILVLVEPSRGQHDSGRRDQPAAPMTQISSALNRQNYSLVLSLCSKTLPTLSDPRQRALVLTYRAAAYRHLGQLEKAKTDDCIQTIRRHSSS